MYDAPTLEDPTMKRTIPTLATLFLAGSLAACDVVTPDPIPAEPPAALGQALAIPGQTVLYTGLRHVAEGEVILQASPGDLTVSNIGSSGLDGVCIDYGSGQGGSTWFAPIGLTQVGARVQPRGYLDGSDVGFVLDLQPDDSDVVLLLDGFGATRFDLEILQDGQRIHRESDLGFPSSAMRLSGDVQLIGTALTGSSVSAATVSAAAALLWNHSITVTCPNGDSFSGDELRFHVEASGPLYPAGWETELRFTSETGPAEVSILSSRMTLGDHFVEGAPRTLVTATGRGQAASFRGAGNPGATGGYLGTLSDLAVGMRGVDVSDDGESFMVEIDGVAAGYKNDPPSLVINLSLGWETGLRIDAGFPQGGSYLTEARCRGALVLAATAVHGEPTDVLPAADGWTGFRLHRLDLDEDRSAVILHGLATRAGEAPQEVRILVQPDLETPFDAAGAGFTYDARGNLGGWSLVPLGSPTLPEGLPQISG